MKKILSLVLAGTLSGFMLMACDREASVEAGREAEQGSQGTYQSPGTTGQSGQAGQSGAASQSGSQMSQQTQGELRRVDAAGGSLVVAGQNGMEQTFRVNEQTRITGTSTEGLGGAAGAMNQLRSLVGKEGTDVTVQWTQQGSDKVATNIQLMTQNQGTPQNQQNQQNRTR